MDQQYVQRQIQRNEQMMAIVRQQADNIFELNRFLQRGAGAPGGQAGGNPVPLPPMIAAHQIFRPPGAAVDNIPNLNLPPPLPMDANGIWRRRMEGAPPGGAARPPGYAPRRGIHPVAIFPPLFPHPLYRQASVSSPPSDEEIGGPPKTSNVVIEGDVISFSNYESGMIGLYMDGKPLQEGRSHFFEIEVLEKGPENPASVIVGLCPDKYPMDAHPGWAPHSIGFNTADGTLFRGRPQGRPFGPACEVGDKIGCGIRPCHPLGQRHVNVFFTHNGKEIVCGGHLPLLLPVPPGGLFPAVSLQNFGEEVSFRHGSKWNPEEDMMVVDGGEDEWIRLHDIQINGQVLEYIGRGKSLIDVGLAQAKTAIGTRNHYFEIEIVDPGASCYIAIGLARKDYPKNRHPGWNKGSIAYHADDGKVFVGSGVGAPFGPRCHKGDVMGCGVLFPRNYECKSDSEEELEQQGGGALGHQQDQLELQQQQNNGFPWHDGVVIHDDYQIEELSDSADEDEWWNDQVFVQSGVQVQIYFTRNGKIIGTKEIRIPKGGFYPTIGMMSCREKVRVDLHPLSG